MDRQIPIPDAAALAYGRPPRPCCPVHGVEMKVISTSRIKRYWSCPVPDCTAHHREPVRQLYRRS
jgi:hypothetical protein